MVDRKKASGGTADKPESCGKALRKYLYLIAAGAVMIVLGTYWSQYYYFTGVGGGILRQAKGAVNAPAAVAGGSGPLPQAMGAANGPVATAQAVNWQGPWGLTGLPVGGQKIRNDFTKIVFAIRNAIVNVNVTKDAGIGAVLPQDTSPADGSIRFANPFTGRAVESVGSGVIVRNDGHILTNYHVVRGANNVLVTVFDEFGSVRYPADIVKLDETTDLALLKIKPKAPLTVAALGDSSRVQVANDVIAIGSPFGLDHTVSRGIVSNVSKSLVIEGVTHRDLIQTDAAINQGNSGGPLVDRNGLVIGINTAIYTPTGAFSGVGFAVSSNQARAFILDEINRLPKARVQAFDQPAAQQRGGGVGAAGPPIVAGVASPHTDGRETMVCENCHMILTKGTGPIPITPVAMQYKFAAPPGSLAKNVMGPAGATQEQEFTVLGANLRIIDSVLAKQLDHAAGNGIFVTSVAPGSPTAKAGVKAGDIILKVEGRRIQIPREMATRLAAVGNGNKARLSVERNGKRQELALVVAVFAPPAGAQAGAAQGVMPGAAARGAAVPTEFNWLGMEIESFVDALGQPGSPAQALKGAQIAEIVPGSVADRAGLMANDVILEIDRQPVPTAAQMDQAIRNAPQQGGKVLRVMRSSREFYVVLE